jgi:hypothetical protein
MAIKNTVAIPMKNGMPIPANNCVVSVIHFPQVRVIYDEAGVATGKTRKITYDLFPYVTEGDITTEGVDFVSGEMDGIPSGWEKEMDDAEYAALLADGTLAEVWLKDQFDIWLAGNAATVVDPYTGL